MVSSMTYLGPMTRPCGVLFTFFVFLFSLQSSLSQLWCQIGKLQSPINIITYSVQQTSIVNNVMFYNYNKLMSANVTYNDHTVNLRINESENVKVTINNKTEYSLRSIHFHVGCTEHKFDNKSYDLEMHLVHQNRQINTEYKYSNENLSVVAVLFKQSQNVENEAINVLLDMIKSNSTYRGVDKKNLEYLELLPKAFTYVYQYSGSLTTPPCNETVLWNVINETNFISIRQIQEFKRLYGKMSGQNSCRPIQFLNNRVILYVQVTKTSDGASTLMYFSKVHYIFIFWFTYYLPTKLLLKS